MQIIIMILHVLVAVALIALVLLQQGKGADIGASFGAGNANTMFGSAGTMSFLMKVTVGLAALFFATSIALNFIASRTTHPASGAVSSSPAESTAPFVPSASDNATTTDS